MGKRITKLLGMILVVAMLLPLIPASLVNSADGNPYGFLVYGVYASGVMKNEVINQVTNLTDYYYYEGRDHRGFKDPWYVTGSPSVDFVSFENNGGAWSSDVYVVPLPNANITPGLTLKSGNGGDWNVKFENKGVYNKNYVDPESELVISCNFSNKQGYLKIGNKSVSGKGRKQLAVKFKDMSEQVVEIGGNKNTKVNGMYGYVRDNTPAYITSVDVEQVDTNLIITAKASEGLDSFGDTKLDEWDRTCIKVTINNTRTDAGTTVLNAYIYEVDDDTLTFVAPLGDWVNKDYTVLELSAPDLKMIDGEVSYSHRELIYNYEWMRGNYPAVSTPGCRHFKSFYVATKSTFLCDAAANPLSLNNITRRMKKSFDNTTPSVNSVSLSVPGKIMNTTASSNSDEWPEDIKLSDLFISEGEKVYFKVTTDEALSKYEGIKLALNVKDENGKQVVLPMYKISTLQTLYGIPQSVMEFGPMTIKKGYSMISGYEGQRIMPLSLTYDIARDGAGHNLDASRLGKPEQQLYLDLTGPTVSVTKLDHAQNSPYATFKVDVADTGSGLNGAPVVVTLKGKSDAAFSFRYLVSDSMAAPTDASAYTEAVQLSGDSTVQIPFKAHAQHEYTCYIHLMLEPGLEQLVDGVVATATTKDVLGNPASAGDCTIDYDYDNVSPVPSVPSLKTYYSYTSGSYSSVRIASTFEGTDHRKIPVAQYIWIIDDPSVPTDDSEWQTASGRSYWDSSLNRYKYSSSTGIDINDGADHTVYLWVKMQDDYGNWCEPVGNSVDVYLSKPSLTYEVLSDVNVPDYRHNVTVTAPPARESDSAIAYTRITMKVGDKTYFRVIKTGESINVFDFDGVWYSGTITGGKYSNITQVTDFTAIKQHYGSITFSFDSAYVDLTPVNDQKVQVSDVSYVNHSQRVSVLYSGVQAEGTKVHDVEFIDFRSSIGEWFGAAYRDEAIRMNLDMTGAMIRFEISNVLLPEWNLVNLDTERSYVVIEKIDGDYNFLEECVRYTGLAATNVQTITVPATKDDGTPFESGAYRFRVGVYQKGSDYVQEFIPNGFIMVLDASNDTLAGLWGYTISSNDDLADEIRVYAEDNNPIQSFGVSAGRLTQAERDRELATYTAGVDLFQFYVGSVSSPQSFYGIEIGSVAGVRFWNAASNPSEEDLAAYEFQKPEYDITVGDETAQVFIGTYGTSDIVDSVPQGAAGLGMTNIYLTAGINTFCCQTISSAGVVSPINYFYVYVTNTNPTLEVSVDSFVPSIRKSEIEGQTNVDSITYRIDEAFSELGDIDFKVIQRNPLNDYTPVYVNGVEYTEKDDYGCIVVPLKAGDLVTIKMDSYSNTLDNATVLFVARDSYGAITVVTPELGEVYRDGYYTNDPESVRFGLYEQDPWKYSDIWTGITYNEPVEIYNAGQDKLNGEDIEGKFVSYIYSADAVLEIVNVTSEDLYVNKYNIESNDISLGTLDRWYDMYRSDAIWSVQDTYAEGQNLDLLDWDNATIEISGDGIDGTVTLPYGASTPNDAGLLWFEYSEYSGLELAFASPITENEAEVGRGLSRSYTIKAKDIDGNEHTFTKTYANYPVLYTDGGASLVYGIDEPIHGVALNLKVYLEDGSNIVHTNMFKDGVYEGTITDAYGTVWPISYEITDTYYDASVIFSTLEPTMNPVTVIVSAENDITISEYDESVVTVTNNGTKEVTITAKENTYFYIDTIGRYVDVSNIFAPSYYLEWSIDDALVENGGEFAGPVTVTLMPGNIYEYGDIFEGLDYEVIDRYTGNNPSFTFYYGDADSYTFKAEDLAFICGDETVVFTEDVTVTLPVTIIETAPFIPGLSEEDYTPVDEESPEVQLLAYTQQNGLYIDTKLMLKVVNGEFSYLDDEYGYTVYETAAPRAATTEFVTALGWGSAYRFQLKAFDISNYRFIIKEGLYAETPGYGDASDTIEGVNLVGRQLTVTKPSAFTLFAVDENGMSTAIPLDLSNIGVAPVPGTVKVPVDEGVRIYLTQPVCEDGQSASDLTIEPSGYEVKVDNDTESEYYGLSYVTVTQNGVYNINYSYMYTFDANKAPSKIEGATSERVIEIRSDKIYLVGSIKWSANAAHSVTNNSVIATMQFSQPVSSIEVPSEFVDSIEVRVNGTIVTVRYDGNSSAIRIRAIAIGGTYTTVDLAAVTNIDKVAPVVTLMDSVLSANGREVTVTLHSDEKALFAQKGNYGTEVDGVYEYTLNVKENGKYTYTFTDMAGNITTIDVIVEGIVDTALKMEYSKDGVTSVTNPLDISLSIGDTVYVRTNRDSMIDINGGEKISAKADTWVELTVTAGMSGLWPIIRAEDSYGNVVLGQLGQVKLPDTKAPTVALGNNIVVVKVGTSVSDVEAKLRSNVTASDLDPDLTYTFEYDIDLSNTGSCQVTYRVSDSSGNVASVNGVLRVAAENEPVVMVNGDYVARDTIYVAEGDSILLSVETLGEPYRVVYKSGLKSVGQMKIGVTDVIRDATTADEILLPFNESGYYTVCIITQSRDYYRIQIYVD